jgi:hypothetical protein
MRSTTHTTASRKALISAIAGFVLQGSWALYANFSFGWGKSVPAALVQGVCSFVMTYACTMMIELILAATTRVAPTLRFVAASAATISFIVVVQASAHWLTGTPQILKTILPAIIIGGSYCVIYSFGRVFLGRSRKGAPAGATPPLAA